MSDFPTSPSGNKSHWLSLRRTISQMGRKTGSSCGGGKGAERGQVRLSGRREAPAPGGRVQARSQAPAQGAVWLGLAVKEHDYVKATDGDARLESRSVGPRRPQSHGGEPGTDMPPLHGRVGSRRSPRRTRTSRLVSSANLRRGNLQGGQCRTTKRIQVFAFVCKNVQGASSGLWCQDEVGPGGPGSAPAAFIPRPPTPPWPPALRPTPRTAACFVAR